MDKFKEVIIKHGGNVVDEYVLVNNDGYIFELEGNRYDARHWRNVYGVTVNYYTISIIGGNKEYDERIQNTIDLIDEELNSLLKVSIG